MTRVWRNANVTYDNGVYFLRALAVYLRADGSVDRASILNFISPNVIAETDAPELVRALAMGTIYQRDVAVMEHDLHYERQSARLYSPDGAVTDLRVESVETTDADSLQGRSQGPSTGKMVEQQTCFVMMVDYSVDVGDVEGPWRRDTWHECHGSGPGNGDAGDDDGYGWPGGGAPGGGGSPNTGATAARVNALLDALIEDPDKLLDVPCDEIRKWLTVGEHEPSDAVLARLAQLQAGESLLNRMLPNEWHVQDIRDARGPQINMDYFSVTMRLPPLTSSSSFFESFRRDLRHYLDTDIGAFRPYAGEDDRWESGPVLGTVGHFDIFAFGGGSTFEQLEDLSVIVSEYVPGQRWKFTTIWSPGDGYHPVSGTREFGIIPNGDGTYTLYTRGTDRISTRIGAELGALASRGGVFPVQFEGADELWKSMQRYVEYEVNSTGGQVTVNPPITHRPDWEAFEAYFNGEVGLSELLDSIDCEELREQRGVEA